MSGNADALIVVALLLAKHFICDFVLQTPYQIRNKSIYGHPGGLLHAGIHAAATALVLLGLPGSWSLIEYLLTGA